MRTLLLVLVLAAACGKKKPSDDKAGSAAPGSSQPAGVDPAEKADLELICFLDDRTAGMSMQEKASYAQDNIKTQKYQDFMRKLAGMSPDSANQRLRDEAKAAGLASCPTAEKK